LAVAAAAAAAAAAAVAAAPGRSVTRLTQLPAGVTRYGLQRTPPGNQKLIMAVPGSRQLCVVVLVTF